MTQNNVKIAVTGGIGSGKSYVLNTLKEKGFCVFSCDGIYKELLKNKDFSKEIAQKLGREYLDGDVINKKRLARAVFADRKKLQKLNEITHPAIIKNAISKMNGCKLSFCEVPLLFECGYEGLFNEVIVVLRQKNARIQSIISRDNITYDEAILRLNSQIDYDNLNFNNYFVIRNYGGLTELKNDTQEIIEKIKLKYL